MRVSIPLVLVYTYHQSISGSAITATEVGASLELVSPSCGGVSQMKCCEVRGRSCEIRDTVQLHIPVRVWLGKIFDDESGFLSTYGCMSARARGGQAFCVRFVVLVFTSFHTCVSSLANELAHRYSNSVRRTSVTTLGAVVFVVVKCNEFLRNL
jgi:hypothetical protein